MPWTACALLRSTAHPAGADFPAALSAMLVCAASRNCCLFLRRRGALASPSAKPECFDRVAAILARLIASQSCRHQVKTTRLLRRTEAARRLLVGEDGRQKRMCSVSIICGG